MQYLHIDNFKSTIAETKGLSFVKFSVANGCKFCTEFAPTYESASRGGNANFFTYETESLAIQLDAIQNEYQVRSFPTVLAFEDGVFKGVMPKYKFNSDRELAGIILDEQKKLYNQQCYVEDLMTEVEMRKNRVDPMNAPLPTPVDRPKEDCTNCEA